jgi:uncharacterized protein with gpF-like domain
MRQVLRQEMKKYRRLMSPAEREAWYRMPPQRIQYPHQYEKQLYKRIREFYKGYTGRVNTFIERKYPQKFVDNVDSFESEYPRFLRELELEIELEIQKGTILYDLSAYVRKITEFILVFNEEEVAACMKAWTGKPMYGTTEWWSDVQGVWMGDMARSVLKNLTEYEEAVRTFVYNGVRNRMSYDEILAGIKQLDTSLSETRAAFLARDLTGKLNGKIEEKLQTSLGIPGYIWQTAADERVRGRPGGKYPNAVPSHWDIDSMTCKWSDPSIYSLDYGRNWVPRTPMMPTTHPGEDWQCRCVGPPSGFSLAREIDRELEGEQNGQNT